MDARASELCVKLTAICENNIKDQYIVGIHATKYRLAFLEGVIATLGELKEILY
jgi:hypothetical protein